MNCSCGHIQAFTFVLLIGFLLIMSPSIETASVTFRDVVVLAPMVRVSTLPLRLLALDYGADLVWTEETIAQKIARCERIFNERLGTVEYYQGRERVFQTCEAEREKLVFQVSHPSNPVTFSQLITRHRKKTPGTRVTNRGMSSGLHGITQTQSITMMFAE
jgi:hypothetical protein